MNNFLLSKQNPWWTGDTVPFRLFQRVITKELIKNLENEKIIALVGSRQVGKTSLLYLLIQHLFKKVKKTDILYFNLDDFAIREIFQNPGHFLQYLDIKKSKKYIFIDEIQRLPNPGLFLKTIFDLKLNIKIIVSGSSQLEMKAKLKEFLVGRIRQFEIPGLSFREVLALFPNIPKKDILQNMLIFGGYPQAVKQARDEEKKLTLHDIYQTYLQKDISDFAKIENIDAFNKLLILLAAQIGGLLNVHSIAKTLKISEYQVNAYIDILEGTFVIKRIYPFFRNYKKEISKTPKIYFLDLGLRNTILGQWQDIALRSDRGVLFENFVFLEFYARDIHKMHRYHFWRTTNQTEIDFILEDGLKLQAIEAKYSRAGMPKSFTTFKKYYPESVCKIVTMEDFG